MCYKELLLSDMQTYLGILYSVQQSSQNQSLTGGDSFNPTVTAVWTLVLPHCSSPRLYKMKAGYHIQLQPHQSHSNHLLVLADRNATSPSQKRWSLTLLNRTKPWSPLHSLRKLLPLERIPPWLWQATGTDNHSVDLMGNMVKSFYFRGSWTKPRDSN